MAETCDAVVVGGGHNGLVAASLLAAAGWDVVVCEANDVAGGAVRSTRSVHPDFVSDLYSAFHPLAAASPVISALHLEDVGLRWSHAPVPLAHVLPDGRCAVLSRDLDETAAGLDTFAPGDGEAWRRLTAEWSQVADHVLGALLRPFPPVRGGLSLARTAGVDGMFRLARLAASTVRRMGEETFRGEGGRLLLAGNALHSDLPPDGAGSAVFGWLLAMLGQTVGWPSPVGGAGRLAEAMIARLTSHGGQVRVATPVERVLVRGGVAHGVRLRSGAAITARRAVLADVSAPQLYEHLLDPSDLPASFRAAMHRRFQWDTPTVKIDWALSSPIPWTARAAARAGTVHVGGGMNDLSRYATDLITGTVPARPFLLLGQMTTSDATRSPAGTESAWAYTHLPEGIELTDDLVADHVLRVQQTIEDHAPGFGSTIVARSVGSPLSISDGLGRGSVNGGTAQLHQQLFFRPVTGLGGADTPIDRLYLAGSSAHPGGGVHGACGSNAARTALRREAVSGRLRRAGVAAVQRRLYP